MSESTYSFEKLEDALVYPLRAKTFVIQCDGLGGFNRDAVVKGVDFDPLVNLQYHLDVGDIGLVVAETEDEA